MLLPPQVDLVLLGIAAIGLVGTLAYLIRGGRLFWVVVGGGIFTVVFVALFVLSLTVTTKVVRISGVSEIHAERGRQLGTADAETLIINDSDKTLTLRGEVYGGYGLPGERPRTLTVAPHSTAPFDGFIDYLGPDEPFPREVSSPSSTTTKYWLSW